jgi:hypothetical protein
VVTITFDDDSFTIVEHVPWAEWQNELLSVRKSYHPFYDNGY